MRPIGPTLLHALVAVLVAAGAPVRAALSPMPVEAQPLAANVERLAQALDYLGKPLPAPLVQQLQSAIRQQDAARIQTLLDEQVLVVVHLNPEVRVKASRGPAPAQLQQHSFTPVILKILNQSTATPALNISSPQAGPVYAGVAKLSMERQNQPHLRANENIDQRPDRFLELALFRDQPMTPTLSGLEVEYAVAVIYSNEAGKREATLSFDVGQGTQDLGFRADIPVLFSITPAVPVRLSILDQDGQPTTGRFLFTDSQGHVYPAQPKRLAPDFFFQRQIYRHHGDTVLLPPGPLLLHYGRGPEYRWLQRPIAIPNTKEFRLEVQLERWVNPADYGFYSGDHHIHAAGCAHYTSPTDGVEPSHMFAQIKGEGLNVGCVLTWGPGFERQSQFFSAAAHELSEPFTVMKYDIEVSGFGSQALGHVCLLNLQEQIYPGANGSRGWPTWTTPVLRWAKGQNAVTGYAHSGSGLQINPPAAARRLFAQLDANHDQRLIPDETADRLLPEPFEAADTDTNGALDETELRASIDRVADQLPNLAIPELNSVGAQEIFVTTALGLCDFISAMDTARIREWNCWYHLLNCGFPLKVSGETDFPCMSGTRVGQGRVYVQLGQPDRVRFDEWCRGLAEGRSYVSDGYAHALKFTVQDAAPGATLHLERPGTVVVEALVAFSPETPFEAAHGGVLPVGGLRLVGDTVNLHPPATDHYAPASDRRRSVELIVNSRVAATRVVPADGKPHALRFELPVEQSSWIALRQFPQLHTNPVNVLLGNRPIRASRRSALWCIEAIEQLWRVRGKTISATERPQARKTFDQAVEIYRQIASEAD